MARWQPFGIVLNIRRRELPLALLMCGYFFLVITSFWVLKPLKKGLFIEHYDAGGVELLGWHLRASQAELLAKVLNVAVAFAAMACFTWLSRRLRRQRLIAVLTGFFMACFALFGVLLSDPGPAAVWSFYLLGDLFSTAMVAAFFAFLADSVTAGQARRIYGLVGLGGVAGGAFGSLLVRSWIDWLPLTAWLWILCGAGVVILALAFAVGRIVDRAGLTLREPQPDRSPERISAALEGARLVFKSRYLLSIVAIVGLYEVISALADFQFTETVAHYLDGPAIGAQFSTVYLVTNVVALLVQLLVTGFVLRRFGVTAALLALPVMILVGSAGFLAAPVLLAGSFLSVADNGLNYSINQSAREALYVPTRIEEKYRAKACIDMFVQRLAKAVGVMVGLGLSVLISEFGGVRWLSLVIVALVVLWISAARRAGRRFQRREEREGAEERRAGWGLAEAGPEGAR